MVAVLELTGTVDVGPSGYFAAVLATIGLGLLVGTWFGRARWLIALGLAAAAALGVAGTTESWGPFTDGRRDVTWTPADYAARGPPLREQRPATPCSTCARVDFTGQEHRRSPSSVGVGSVRVYLPPEVDVTAVADGRRGRVAALRRPVTAGSAQPGRERTDLGPDGPGGGRTLADWTYVSTSAHVEVTR